MLPRYEVEWRESEWSSEVWVAYRRGLELEAHADGFWAIKTTAAVSEYPEVYTAGEGRPGIEVAKRAAERAFPRATAHYGEPAAREEGYR